MLFNHLTYDGLIFKREDVKTAIYCRRKYASKPLRPFGMTEFNPIYISHRNQCHFRSEMKHILSEKIYYDDALFDY